jgi:hypothetical protein
VSSNTFRGADADVDVDVGASRLFTNAVAAFML